MRCPASAGTAISCLLLAGCAAPPEGTARVEVALPEQALNISADGPVADANLHSDDFLTVNLLRVSSPVAMHRHLESEEVVYVISGEGILHLKDSDRPLTGGDLAIVPRNTPHGFEPTGPHPAVVLLQVFVPRFVTGDRVFEGAPK
jgi:mannose-6-phosphate isomerase-like protein (cupin superfamily)